MLERTLTCTPPEPFIDLLFSPFWITVTLFGTAVKLQRLVARIIMRLGSSDKPLNYLGYVTLDKRRKSHTLKLVKKCLSNRCPHFFTHYFYYNKDVLPRRLRSTQKLRLPSIKLECTKKAFLLSRLCNF